MTLYHWDLPQALEDRGGWPARETAEAFAEYAEVVAARLGDRVRRWITQNEPWVIAWLGYGRGRARARPAKRRATRSRRPPRASRPRPGGRGDPARRAGCPGRHHDRPDPDAPADRPPEDDLVATCEEDGFRNRWFLDPVLRGSYPEDCSRRFARDPPHDRGRRPRGDLRAARLPRRQLLPPSRRPGRCRRVAGRPWCEAEGGEHTVIGWEVYPDGLYELLVRLHEDYDPPPLYVTENGAAFGDTRRERHASTTRERTSYLERHLAAVARAIAAGVPVAGYFVWSLLDNFEWARGYSQRFGLVYVDFETLERVPKRSYHWYRDFIAGQRERSARSIS